MSAVYSKDPETGVYRTAENPSRPKSWLLLIPCLLGIVALVAWSPNAKPAPREAVKASEPALFDISKAPPSLRGAVELFRVRGGKYKYGHNDCSSFLLDYLAGHGIRSANRQTTATLVDTRMAAHMHLYPMDELELARPIDQSVVVIRYRGLHEQVGHCAVRVFQNGKPYFVHNCESDGLVFDEQAAFYRRFDKSSIRDVRYYRFESGF